MNFTRKDTQGRKNTLIKLDFSVTEHFYKKMEKNEKGKKASCEEEEWEDKFSEKEKNIPGEINHRGSDGGRDGKRGRL